MNAIDMPVWHRRGILCKQVAGHSKQMGRHTLVSGFVPYSYVLQMKMNTCYRQWWHCSQMKLV